MGGRGLEGRKAGVKQNWGQGRGKGEDLEGRKCEGKIWREGSVWPVNIFCFVTSRLRFIVCVWIVMRMCACVHLCVRVLVY